MRRINIIATGLALLWFASPALAKEQTATLKVEGMSCASCPYQVKKSLTQIDGVTSAEVSLETNKAVVVFDDAKTDIAALTEATAGAGFPSAEMTSAN